ncbi:MAG: D-alanyl-D-alanine carboxypeptidase, partial [Holosporaceae bacterium]|nr:D-alanyl-D-alanine carboxypeptidase [Holosporaceae bacterium]
MEKKSVSWFSIFAVPFVFLCSDCAGKVGAAISIAKRGAIASKQFARKTNSSRSEEKAAAYRGEKTSQHSSAENVVNNTEVQEKETSSSTIQYNTEARQAIVMDCDTGEVLFAKQQDEKCVPSSMTKLMTIYLLFEALVDGRIHLDDKLPVSEKAQRIGGSKSFFETKNSVSLEDIIRSIVVHSGNDGCIVFAEKLSGDEDAFAAEMNQKAQELGMKNTNFLNSTGLPNPDHCASVSDLALLTRRLIADFPQFYHYFSEKTFTYNSITQESRNTLLGNSLNVDGLKTGFTKDGGYGIAISAKKDGKRLIAIVNGCRSNKVRLREANRLLAMGFKEFITIKIADPAIASGKFAVSAGKRNNIDLFVKEPIVPSIPKRHRKSLIIELNVQEPIPAPITAGTKLGELTYKYHKFISKKYALFA